MNSFCGGKFSDKVSSEKILAVYAAGPPAAFFPEIDMSGFFGHAHLGKKCDFAQICTRDNPRNGRGDARGTNFGTSRELCITARTPTV